MNKFSLYVLYSTEDFKIRYVGITTKSLAKRLSVHIYNSIYKKKTHKDKWICKCIDNRFEIRIKKIQEFQNREELFQSEINLIKILKDRNYNITNGTSGGDGINNLSEETRKRMSDIRLGTHWSEFSKNKLSKTKTGQVSNSKGCKWSESSKNLQSKNRKGKPSNRPKVKVRLYINLILEQSFDSISDAAIYYNISPSVIGNNLTGRSKTTKQGIWKY